MDTEKMSAAISRIIEGFQGLQDALGGPQLTAMSDSPKPQLDSADLGTFDKLKKALESEKWPQAVNRNLCCDQNSETDLKNRGRGIIELMIDDPLQELKFLDFGCGTGFTTMYSAELKTSLSVGYDKTPQKWDRFPTAPNLLFTDQWAAVVEKGPYDLVLLFEVLDHLDGETATSILEKINSVLKPGGKVFIRTHPLTSRHATHHYYDINKAFIHLVFSPEELKMLQPSSEYALPNHGPQTPLIMYGRYFDKAGFDIVTKREIRDPVESFFKIPVVAQRIMDRLNTTTFPEFQLGLSFIDYCLAKRS
jgi:2-polyprenyl-3-methyl-5-hydroxy-6-metoxy-1,4-benzoquinol methylase